MTNPLDPIYKAYLDTAGAIKVARRCAALDTIDERRPFGQTPFEKCAREEVLDRLKEADGEIEDLVVLALYAAFERRLRDHVLQSGRLLASAGPPSGLGAALVDWFGQLMDEYRMDVIAAWFRPPVNETTYSKIPKIRTYRHWVAHGRNANNPAELVTPTEAYGVLTEFLQEAGLLAER